MTSIGIILLIVMIGLILLGMPVPMAIGFASMVCIFKGNYENAVLAQKMFSGIDSFTLLAIPYFVLAGNIMGKGGITEKILDWADAVFGWLKGSLAIITVAASAIFAALTGSGVATVSAIGGITIPAMENDGYDKHFAVAVASNAAILGPLIPPSIFLITYGNAAEANVNTLFKAAVIPGIFMAICMGVYCWWYAKKHNLKAGQKFNLRRAGKATKDGIWALLMPILLLGIIFTGVCTPTEAAAVACVYTFIVALFIYRTINFKQAFNICEVSTLSAGVMMFLMGNSKISGWVLAIAKVPATIAAAITNVSDSPLVIMLLINIFLLFVGMFVEGNAAIVILTPILLPIAKLCGLSAVQFGIIMCVNLCMGLVTPPVGGCLVIGNEIGKGHLEISAARCLPFLAVDLVTLIICTLWMPFTSWLPTVLAG